MPKFNLHLRSEHHVAIKQIRKLDGATSDVEAVRRAVWEVGRLADRKIDKLGTTPPLPPRTRGTPGDDQYVIELDKRYRQRIDRIQRAFEQGNQTLAIQYAIQSHAKYLLTRDE